MVNKGFGFFSILLVLLIGVTSFGLAFSGAGTGTLANPFNITNCTQLEEIDDDNDANYSLINDINFSSAGCEEHVQGNGWLPLGKMGGAFVGTFFGNNHVIYNLYIRNTVDNPAGLFGNASLDSDNYGKFYDIGLENVNITANQSVGGLVGYGRWVIINNSYVTGEISGNLNVGGLLGSGDSSAITYSYSDVVVSGGDYTGGLVGDGNGIEINNSFAMGDVVGSSYSGGLIGSATNSIIYDSYAIGDVNGTSMVGGLSGSVCCGSDPGRVSRSYATGDILGTSNWVGGLIGDGSDGIIDLSYAIGKVRGVTNVGGLIGEGQNLTLRNSYSTGNVTGSSYVGGLIGYLWNSGANRGLVNFTYSAGNVTGTTNVGGLIGNLTLSDINYSYYDTNASGKSDTGRGTPQTTVDMSNFALYLGNWNITTVNIGETDSSNIWNFNATNIYPFLSWEDIISPVVHLVAPLNNSVSVYAEVNHSFNVTDVSDLVSCTMYWDDFSVSNSVAFDPILPDGETLELVSLTSTDGIVNWTVNCTDLAGNVGPSEVWSYLVATVPQITSVSSGNPSTTTATISWTTNESSNASVRYGTSSTNLATRVDDTGFGTSQSISLTGLAANTLYYYNVTSCDSSGNCNTSGPRSFTTDAVSTGSTGGGGGGGGGEETSLWLLTYPTLGAAEFDAGYSRELANKNRVGFVVGSETHHVGVVGIGAGSATINVSSVPQIKTLNVGDEWKVELTGDSYYDLLVKLNNVNATMANITIKSVSKTQENVVVNNTVVKSDLVSENSVEGLSMKIKIIVGVAVIIVILAIIAYFILRRQYVNKKLIKSIRYANSK